MSSQEKTREEKIKAIYKKMENKDGRDIGSKVNVKYTTYYHGETGSEESHNNNDYLIIGEDYVARNGDIEIKKSDFLKADSNGYIEDLDVFAKVLGRPVMLGDVTRRIANNKQIANSEILFTLLGQFDFGLWEDMRSSIEEQTDECIDFIYSLL